LLALLVVVLVRQRPEKPTRRALVFFLLIDAALVASAMVTLVILHGAPPVSVREFWVTLTVDLFALTTIAAFLLVAVAADLMRDALVVVVRAGFVFWIVYQWPMWRGTLVHLVESDSFRLHLHLNEPAMRYGFALLLAYQLLAILFANRYRQRFRQPCLANGLIMLQVGHLLVMTMPFLREWWVPTWLAVPFALVVGYGILERAAAGEGYVQYVSHETVHDMDDPQKIQ
jgi:hypothetical protein